MVFLLTLLASRQTLRFLKSTVILNEQLVLRALAFDTNLDVPHRHLLNIARYYVANELLFGGSDFSFLSSPDAC